MTIRTLRQAAQEAKLTSPTPSPSTAARRSSTRTTADQTSARHRKSALEPTTSATTRRAARASATASTPLASGGAKRKRAPSVAEWHGLPGSPGTVTAAEAVRQAAMAQPAQPRELRARRADKTATANATADSHAVKIEDASALSSSDGTAGKRHLTASDAKDDPRKLHGKRARSRVKEESDDDEMQGKPAKPTRAKKQPYGLSPGQSPFPDFPAPSPKVCEEVKRLLEDVHGKSVQPQKIPAPSLQVSGCGEVPSILDAMIRTLLSAATSSTNSSRAFRGLVQTFGLLDEGIGKGSVDWNKVREADVKDIFEAIKSGGLAAVKSKNIKKILEMVYEQNLARRAAFVKEKELGLAADSDTVDGLTQRQKDAEIAKADAKLLSLDHMHSLDADAAMAEFIKFPGIGVKTASCILLFCMQRPSFAVDTHIYRICQWLNWVPAGATRDQTYSHLDTRIPDHLKYPLHTLLIKHGRNCGRCRAITAPGSEDWEAANCPIEHLVTRTGRKAIVSASSQKVVRPGKRAAQMMKYMDSSSEDSADEFVGSP